jgi:acyl-CoA thioesterase
MKKDREGKDGVTFTGPHRFAMEGWISMGPFERFLHMEIVEAADGKATLTMPFLFDLAQGAGIMHGGALVSLADTAVAMAIKSLLPTKTHFGTISVEAKFLYPVKQGIVTAKAHVLGRQDRILTGQALVYNEEDRPVLEFQSSFKIARDSNVRGITFGET